MKILEILFKKRVNIYELKNGLFRYNRYRTEPEKLTEEEYDLLWKEFTMYELQQTNDRM